MKHEVIFDYSIEAEIWRVKYTLKRHEWYKENGYKPKYPLGVQRKLESNEEITETDISESVVAEFNNNEYLEFIALVQEAWNIIKEKFFEKLSILGVPIQDRYFVYITKYGTGGRYSLPNNIQLNLARKDKPHMIIAHEIVHLTIEPLIKESGMDHWIKERLVDLIMNRFFPENQSTERDPENAEKISEIFEREFPNIEKVIGEVARLK